MASSTTWKALHKKSLASILENDFRRRTAQKLDMGGRSLLALLD